MSKPKRVYAVSSGCYSDYSVERIFEQEADAQAFAAAFGADYGVEEFDFHTADSPAVIHTVYRAQWESSRQQLHESSDRVCGDEPKHDTGRHLWPTDRTVFWASGPDHERVRKSVTDRAAQWIAEREGIA